MPSRASVASASNALTAPNASPVGARVADDDPSRARTNTDPSKAAVTKTSRMPPSLANADAFELAGSNQFAAVIRPPCASVVSRGADIALAFTVQNLGLLVTYVAARRPSSVNRTIDTASFASVDDEDAHDPTSAPSSTRQQLTRPFVSPATTTSPAAVIAVTRVR